MPSVRTLSTSALALVAFASVAGAQQAAPSRWQGYLGCWTAAAMGESYGSAQFAAPIVCITPTSSPDAVQLSTIAEGKVVSTERLDAGGTPAPLEIKDCTGTKTARWSKDDRRVFLQSEMNCNGAPSTATSILSMTNRGEWIDVRGVSAGGNQNIRVARYRDVGLPSSVPADIANALRGNMNSVYAARVAAGSPYSLVAVQEAAYVADSSVVEAWLLERGERFNVKAEHLVALADAGVPAKVIDAVVAVSNPGQFNLARVDVNQRGNDDDVVGRRQVVILDRYDPWGYGYSRYGYGYGYGSGYGYGYGPYYGGYGYGYGGPIIIVNGNNQGGTTALGQPQMVKGRGYTQNQPGSTSTRSGVDRSSSSSSSGSSGASQSSAPAPQPAQQSQPAEQRTAKPRP